MKCGGTRNQPAGIISSSNFPRNYNNITKCIWTITVKPTNKITLSFTNFALEPDGSCLALLTVYDGLNVTDPKLGTYCGTKSPGSLYSTNNKMLVIFQSYGRLHGKGFRAYYESGNNAKLSGNRITHSNTWECKTPNFLLHLNYINTAVYYHILNVSYLIRFTLLRLYKQSCIGKNLTLIL